MRKLAVSLIVVLGFFLFLFPFSHTGAIDEAKAAEVNMTTSVSSPVSKENSSVQFNAYETLADPVNHPILLTVNLLDKNQKPLVGREVVVTSNRGIVDIIEATSKLAEFQVPAAEVSAMQKDKTDNEGNAQFRMTSFVPGSVFLKIMADNVVELPSETIKFTALPFPAELVLSTNLPGTSKELTIYSSRIQEENLSIAQIEAKKLADPETKIKISFWILTIFLFIIIGMPIFIVLNFINLRKIRRMESEQSLLLKKNFPTDSNRQS